MPQRTRHAPPLGPSYSSPSPEGQVDELVQPPRISRSRGDISTGFAEVIDVKAKAATARVLMIEEGMVSSLCR